MISSQCLEQNIQHSINIDYDIPAVSMDKRLQNLVKTVVKEVKLYAQDQIKHIRQYAQVGLALSIENDINKLLEMIVVQSRLISNADAGTLYIFDENKKQLSFKIVQNESLNIYMGGTSSNEVRFPNIPIYIDGSPNYSTASTYVAHTGEMINIPDVYEVDGFDFTGPRIYDKATGYRSKSMLVIPLKNHENKVIGILQLLNAQNPDTGEIISFAPDHVDLIASLASQAAVAITNTQLILNLKNLFGHVKHLADIGRALSVENDINKLLEDIVNEAKELGNADGGTLYEVNKTKQSLSFKIMHNDSLSIRMGGKSGKAINLADVPLHIDEKPNYSNVSSYVALTGESVNIADVYEEEGFDFSGTKKYDAKTGYRSKSMLVIPMKNHEKDIIGVLQLLNSQNSDKTQIVPFPKENVDLIESLASQAAVALTKTKLIQDLRNLFYSFIRSIATAVDKKSPYTGGHIERVVKLTEMIAKKINETTEGPLKDIHLTEEQLEELRLAAWMHDVGKITTPEHIVDKASKLQTIFDRIGLVETRFKLIAKHIENEYLQRKIDMLQNGRPDEAEMKILDEQCAADITAIYDELEFIKSCNKSGEFMSDAHVERVQKIAAKTFRENGSHYPYLTENEVENLCIRKGTLTVAERKEIENHASMTWEILKQLPFPRNLSNVPEYAASHHEKLNGKGYSRGLSGDSLPLQARIIAVADVFEALTAKDRPYKEPMKLSQAVKILEFMKKDGHIDPDIHDLFIGTGLYRKYAERELAPKQMDG